ncbi:NAD(P)/FAD-dependent oxidoreductase [Aspergillus saccharolyticus JOP 1030-1]|uniref:FAD/NAD(P)-binding domain-containing protein n=1 Tax=Aspergillus saccharolyticus JOP 1030-1 TaxID=1450539 RepID=A0A318Z217_9EURO|nr:FAD/NAD(P)-binding domain-containing protein [Aspergillus saccharolyticus JOP 1030-1]PYH41331.1 FAD/NAD(P)-binding domain-containing protein [Aspergillus saccharolyticus JOP 1030-1]
MFRSSVTRAARAVNPANPSIASLRTLATAAAPSSTASPSPVSSSTRSHKILVVGGGSAGLNVSHQLLRTGQFTQDDIAIIDPAEWHHYQPGWTLVGGGVKTKEELRRPLPGLLDPKLKLYGQAVDSFTPEQNTVTLANGDRLGYEQLIVVPGIHVNFNSIRGLPEALADPNSLVSSIYGYEHVDKVYRTLQKLKSGKALFTQPAGVLKCAGAPQKIMWLALDHWKQAGLYDPSNPSKSAINISFATGLPAMFGVPKYSASLEALRQERGVEGLFQHDLVAVEGNTATFAKVDGSGAQVQREFDLLHVVPKMGPHAFVKNSPLADAAGFVDVDNATTQHKKFKNVWSIGDASSLPTSKTAAAVIAEAPVMVRNLLRAAEGKAPDAEYDGYTSCPLTTEYGKVLLAEFKYAGVPKETFGSLFGIDQATPRKAFWQLKKNFFPWVYYNNMVKGTWAGPKGWIR